MPKMNPFFEEVKKGNTISAISRRVIENVLTGIPEKKQQVLQSTQYYFRQGKKKHRYLVKLRRSCEPSC